MKALAAASFLALPVLLRGSASAQVPVALETRLAPAIAAARDTRDRLDAVAAAMEQLGVDRPFAERAAAAHERVPCAVGECTPAQLRAKLEIMGPGRKLRLEPALSPRVLL